MNRAESSRSAASSGEAAVEVIEAVRNHLDHEFEEDDEDMIQVPAGTEDLLVPGLDYEVSK